MRVLDSHPEWLEALRSRLLTRELLAMPQILADFMETTNRRFEEVDRRFERWIAGLMGWIVVSSGWRTGQESSWALTRGMRLSRKWFS